MKKSIFFLCLHVTAVLAVPSSWVSVDLPVMQYKFEDLELARQIRHVYLSDRYGDLGKLTLLKNLRRFPIINTLSECRNRLCPLYRGHINLPDNVSVRTLFERKLVKKIADNFETNKPLVLTSFFSGKLFSEFLLVNKLLDHGYRDITINLVDPAYADLIDIWLNQKRVQSLPVISKDSFIKRDSVLTIYERIVQFVRWFQNYGDGAHVKVVLYKYPEAYLQHCSLMNGQKSNVLVMMDPYLGPQQESGYFDVARWGIMQGGIVGILAKSIPDYAFLGEKDALGSVFQ